MNKADKPYFVILPKKNSKVFIVYSWFLILADLRISIFFNNFKISKLSV